MPLLFCMDMRRDSVPWTKQRNEPCSGFLHTTGQRQCVRAQIVAPQQTLAQERSSNLASPASRNNHPVIPMLLITFLLVASLLSPVLSLPIVSDSGVSPPANQTFHPGKELHRLKRVRTYLRKINKPAVKTIQAYNFVFLGVLYGSITCIYWVSRLTDLDSGFCCRAPMVIL